MRTWSARSHLEYAPARSSFTARAGTTLPKFAHLSLVLGPDHAPLSKRHGATSVAEFRDRGILPEALVNYLALLGWSPGENEELLPAAEMARRFDLSHVSHSAAVFDTGKLAWMNRHYMIEAPPGRIAREALKYFVQAGYVTQETDVSLGYVESLLPMALGSVDRLEEMPERLGFIFSGLADRAASSSAPSRTDRARWRRLPTPSQKAGPLDREVPCRGGAPRESRAQRDARCSIRSGSRSRPPTPVPSSIWPCRRSIVATLSPTSWLVAIRSCAERAALAVDTRARDVWTVSRRGPAKR